MFEGNLSDYELLFADSIETETKKGYLFQYRKIENKNKSDPYKVSTYHTIGILRFDDSILKIRSFSFGFNLNPSIENIFKYIIETPNSPSKDSLATAPITVIDNLNIFPAHLLGTPKKYLLIGIQSQDKLELRYKNDSTGIVYYLTSYLLPENTDLIDYFDDFNSSQKQANFETKYSTFKNVKCLHGHLFQNGIHIYQLHFVLNAKGQTIQMASPFEASAEFDSFSQSIEILSLASMIEYLKVLDDSMSPDSNLILTDQVGFIQLGDSMTNPGLNGKYEIQKEIKTFYAEEGGFTDTIYMYSISGENHFYITKYYNYNTKLHDNFIGEITILSDAYKTPRGIGVNSTIEDFINAYPDFEIWYTYISDRFVIQSKTSKIQFLLYNEDYLGTQYLEASIEYLTSTDFKTNSKIREIRIY